MLEGRLIGITIILLVILLILILSLGVNVYSVITNKRTLKNLEKNSNN
ncbi:hypothetical protein [Avibacterium paragallinarum]|nr:hypothetical protein [Avibacterium paragallinarum]QIR11593.1 hypothetical protein HBL79_04665 [Avibacterium paragallinarum]QJE09433.1 hypothetical protein HHJ62_03485 [Avibacterium paragallinarum]QJE11629.1 hypothetical protein HHJ61_03485 [Avibacterium paragallinarum]QJE13828.1 hypothetical protein HHJ60_03495 [Avibacterium paragallinarum]QJE16029.1 hypothetical protein HHJ59_03490 [Avibacterium paragallinarum]